MTRDEAAALEQFVKDHDTRFEAQVSADGADASLLLRDPRDGTQLEPVRSSDEYRARFIAGCDPGPTIRESFEKWLGERAS